MPDNRNKKNGVVQEDSTHSASAPGKSPELDAWLASFFIENHLDAFTYPDHAASDEQVRFMVYTEGEQRYYPCSDVMFEAIISRGQSALIQKHYNRALQNILQLIEHQIEDAYEKAYLESLIINKYKHETQDEIMLPSRVEKRLMSIYLKRTQINDPFAAEKSLRNRRALEWLNSKAFADALNHVDVSDLKNPPETLEAIKSIVAAVEFKRLICMANHRHLWKTDNPTTTPETMDKTAFLGICNQKIKGDGFRSLVDFLGCGRKNIKKRKLLWLADEAGQTVMDMALIEFLSSYGHKIIVAFKGGPLFTKTTLADVLSDPSFQHTMSQAAVIDDPNLSKNDLVRTLRGDVDILVLSDNTSEKINLLLTSTTFARFFKEVDGVISRGLDQRHRLFDTHFQFTQDIYSISEEDDGSVSVEFKPRHPAVIKFSHKDLEKKAQAIIDQMKSAKENGMTVIFYSGIIGSIPGKIEMAKRIMSVFIQHLTEQSVQTFIINPSEYYEPGMDADDLMYMWEIVQRSGQIDIWRFQTYDDIAEAFEIINKKIPPEWVGKDATYSTGCTKEMGIAIDVQKKHPEMQIIGPAKERFMRRQEYGVGKMYDRRLSDRVLHY